MGAVLLKEQKRELIKLALQARQTAYMPYSGFAVGAALLSENGRIYTGCNVENASYGATNCAERTAFFKAVSEGERTFLAIAIAGGKKDEEPVAFAYPCGICRQVMREFCKADFCVLVAKSETVFEEYTLQELLPKGFGGENLS